MIYVTGDMHGDISRFKSKEVRKLQKGDYLIICGDFGFVWSGSKQEKKQLNWIGNRRFTTLFIDGTHENFDLLGRFPETEMFGGIVRQLGKRLYHLGRGYVFELEGKKIFALGGGEGDEQEIRTRLATCWRQEMPSSEELRGAAYSLEDVHYAVDYIVTYESSITIKNSINVGQDSINPLNAFLERVLRQCTYEKWFFGCYHMDRKISQVQRAVFKNVVPVEDVTPLKRR